MSDKMKAKGPVKATQLVSAKQLVSATQVKTVSSPFEKRVADMANVPLVAKAKTESKEGFFTGLRNKAPSAEKKGKIDLKSKHLGPASESLISQLSEEETDERYRYLLKHGNVHAIEHATKTIYVELPQISGIIIVYRRPSER